MTDLIQGLECDGGRENGSKVKVESLTPMLDSGQGDGVSSEDGRLDKDGVTTCSSPRIENQLFPSDSSPHLGEKIGGGQLDDSMDQPVVNVVEDEKGSLNVQSEVDSNLERNEISSQSQIHRRPGVILLGRGNSFSLGRSEVIVIHHRHKRSSDIQTNRTMFNCNKENKLVLNSENNNSHSSHRSSRSYPLSRIQEQQDSDYDDIVEFESWKEVDAGVVSNIPLIPSPSPPPISNGLSHADNCDYVELSNGVNDDLTKDLWQKAEAVMAMRNDRVRRILEEFGIGEPGGGGGEEGNDWEDEDVEERKKEEEDVWRIIQENFQV